MEEIFAINGNLSKTSPLEPTPKLERDWKIDKKHLYFRILKAWLPDCFWVFDDKLILEITNTLRKISWETLKILKKETKKEVSLPLIIISPTPSDILILEQANEERWDPEILCDPGATTKNLGLATVPIAIMQMHQILSLLVGEAIISGSSSRVGVGIWDSRMENLFKTNFSPESKNELLKTVIEETLHYFCQNTNYLNHEQMKRELTAVRMREDIEYDIQERICHQVEEKYGIKTKRGRIFEKMEEEKIIDDIFLPLTKIKIEKSGGAN